MVYCGKAEFGQIYRSFSLNSGAIRLKRSKNLPQIGLSLATIGQVRQAASPSGGGGTCWPDRSGASLRAARLAR